MRKLVIFACACALSLTVGASWYWPFGSDDDSDGKRPPRLSELMEEASDLIDEASDLAADGKISDSVEKYRAALDELDRVERENPERAQTTEFATLRNKRAYVNAAIDSLLLRQVQANAKKVTVSNTAELEKKLAEEKRRAKGEPEPKAADAEADEVAEEPGSPTEQGPEPAAEEEKPAPQEPPVAKPAEEQKKPPKPLLEKPKTRREQAMADIVNGDYAAAELIIREMLEEKPNGAMALNLKSAMEAAQGKLKEAEQTLDTAISSNPRNYFAYYNMARLYLRKEPPNRNGARKFYETGRTLGGPVDAQLEDLLK